MKNPIVMMGFFYTNLLSVATSKERGIIGRFLDKVINFLSKDKKLDVLPSEVRRAFEDAAGEFKQLKEQFLNALEVEKKVVENSNERVEKKTSGEEVKMSKDLSGSVTQDTVSAVRSIGRKNINNLSSLEINTAEPFARLMWKSLNEKSPFFRAWFGDWRANDKKTLVHQVKSQSSTRGLHHNNDTGWDINHSAKVHGETHLSKASVSGKMFLPYIDGIIENAILLNSEISDNDNENSIMFHSLYSVVNDGGNKAVIKLIVEEMQNPGKNIERRAYKLVDIEKLPAVSALGSQMLTSSQTVDSINSISDLFDFVKTHDQTFNPKPSSVVTNDDGTPKIVYHGTNKDFSIFESSNGTYWFSESYDYAESMAEERKGSIVKGYYLDIKNPYYAKLAEGKFSDPAAEREIIKKAKDGNYDGAIIECDTDNELVYDKFFVVFEKTQIKSATDNIGTFDRGNNNTRYSKDLNSTSELFDDERAMSFEDIDSQIKEDERLSKEDLLLTLEEKSLKRWGAEIAGTRKPKGEVLSPEAIVKKVEEAFGVPITAGGTAELSEKNFVSLLRKNEKTITSKFQND